MSHATVACAALALVWGVCVAAAPAPQAAQPPAGKVAGQTDQTPSVAVARLTKEKAQLSAELLKKDQQIATLTRLLKENGIDVPDGATQRAGSVAVPSQAVAKGKPGAPAVKSEADSAVPAPAADAPSKGPWTVRIVSNEEPSQDELKDQLGEAIGKLRFADEALAQAKLRHDQMAGAREEYRTSRGRWDLKSKYTNAELGEPRRDVAKAEAEKRRAAQTVARLERQIADAGKTHMVVGQLEDGTTAEITAAGPAQVQLARGLQVGERYKIAGTGRIDAGSLRLRMNSAARVADEASPARVAGQVRRRLPIPVEAVGNDEGQMDAAEPAGEGQQQTSPAEPKRPSRPLQSAPF